jgi:hypothetical protein
MAKAVVVFTTAATAKTPARLSTRFNRANHFLHSPCFDSEICQVPAIRPKISLGKGTANCDD